MDKAAKNPEGFRVLSFIYSDVSAVLGIADSPLNDTIMKIIERIRDDEILMDIIETTNFHLGATESGRYVAPLLQAINDRYNQPIDPIFIKVFICLLLTALRIEIHDAILVVNNNGAKHFELVSDLDTLNSMDVDSGNFLHFISKIGIIHLFYILNYDITERNQWPFSDETVLELLARKLNEFGPTASQLAKIPILGIKEYKGISVEKLKDIKLLATLCH